MKFFRTPYSEIRNKVLMLVYVIFIILMICALLQLFGRIWDQIGIQKVYFRVVSSHLGIWSSALQCVVHFSSFSRFYGIF
jgi:hypothetical protein